MRGQPYTEVGEGKYDVAYKILLIKWIPLYKLAKERIRGRLLQRLTLQANVHELKIGNTNTFFYNCDNRNWS